jgi:protein SCO1
VWDQHVGDFLAGKLRLATSFGLIGMALAATAVPATQPVAPVVAISAHFALQATNGRQITDANFRGKWLVVYFGYTSCPDVCPTVILRIGKALTSIGSAASQIQAVFITVDPARDTSEHLAKYMASFDPRVLGLRGDAAQTQEAAKQFHVYYRKRSLDSGDYSVDHSSFLYIVDPQGNFSKLLADTLSADQMAAELRTLVSRGRAATPSP